MIHRPPQVDHLAIELHIHLVEVPSPMTKAAHRAHPLATDFAGQHWPKPVPPMADRLVADVDPALSEQVFHIPQRQREADVHHYN